MKKNILAVSIKALSVFAMTLIASSCVLLDLKDKPETQPEPEVPQKKPGTLILSAKYQDYAAAILTDFGFPKEFNISVGDKSATVKVPDSWSDPSVAVIKDYKLELDAKVYDVAIASKTANVAFANGVLTAKKNAENRLLDQGVIVGYGESITIEEDKTNELDVRVKIQTRNVSIQITTPTAGFELKKLYLSGMASGLNIATNTLIGNGDPAEISNPNVELGSIRAYVWLFGPAAGVGDIYLIAEYKDAGTDYKKRVNTNFGINPFKDFRKDMNMPVTIETNIGDFEEF